MESKNPAQAKHSKSHIYSDTRISQLIDKIQLERLNQSHIEDIARLHYKILSWSFNGQFGLPHITAMYASLFKSPYSFGYGYYRNGILIGFVVATTNFTDARRNVLDVYKGKICQTLSVLFRNPKFILGVLESKFLVPIVFRKFGIASEWLTFVTDTSKSYLSPLVALRMINGVRDHFRTVGVKGFMAQGVKDNPRAIKMYEKLNWLVVARLPIHNIYYYPTDGSSKTEENN